MQATQHILINLFALISQYSCISDNSLNSLKRLTNEIKQMSIKLIDIGEALRLQTRIAKKKKKRAQ